MNLSVHALVRLEVRRPGPCRLLAQPFSILVPLDGRAALNIRIKPNNISREQPAQQAQVSLKGGRGGWGSPGLHKRVSVVRIFGRSAQKVGETAATGAGSIPQVDRESHLQATSRADSGAVRSSWKSDL